MIDTVHQLLPLPHTEISFTFQHLHTEVILQTEVDLGLQKVMTHGLTDLSSRH
jgi:hypothetical protein